MNKHSRLQNLYTIAKDNGVCSTKKDFALLIGAGYTTLVRTMNGEKQYSPDRFILAAEDMLRKNGIDPNQEVITINDLMAEIKKQRELIEKLLELEQKRTHIGHAKMDYCVTN